MSLPRILPNPEAPRAHEDIAWLLMALGLLSTVAMLNGTKPEFSTTGFYEQLSAFQKLTSPYVTFATYGILIFSWKATRFALRTTFRFVARLGNKIRISENFHFSHFPKMRIHV